MTTTTISLRKIHGKSIDIYRGSFIPCVYRLLACWVRKLLLVVVLRYQSKNDNRDDFGGGVNYGS